MGTVPIGKLWHLRRTRAFLEHPEAGIWEVRMARTDLGEALQVEAGLMQKLARQLGELASWGLAELRAKHLELFGEEARSKNLPFLRKKLAFRLQERVEGGVGPEARAHLETLMPETLPVRRSKEPATSGEPGGRKPQDPRLPAPGTVLTRDFRDVAHVVEVLEHGFRYRGRTYTSLSTLAREITGTAWNGFTFFGLGKGARRGSR